MPSLSLSPYGDGSHTLAAVYFNIFSSGNEELSLRKWQGVGRERARRYNITRIRSINLLLRCTIYRPGFSVFTIYRGKFVAESRAGPKIAAISGKVNSGVDSSNGKPLNFGRKQSKTTDRHRNVELNHFPRPISDVIKPPRGSAGHAQGGRSAIVHLIFNHCSIFIFYYADR